MSLHLLKSCKLIPGKVASFFYWFMQTLFMKNFFLLLPPLTLMAVMFISLNITALSGMFILLAGLALATVCFYQLLDNRRPYKKADEKQVVPEMEKISVE